MAVVSHDIGKVSLTFVAKFLSACGINFKEIPELAKADPVLERGSGGHAGVSQATAEELDVPKHVAEILGHHRFNPSVDDKRGYAESFGGFVLFDQRRKLVAALKECLQAYWPTFENAAQAREVAGLTSVEDWLGSGEFFEAPSADWRPNISVALNDAGFIKPIIRPNLSFTEVFDPINKKMQPCEKATGIYFALPTQLTSKKIYDRFNAFLEQILAPETHNRALLLHSGVWLLDGRELRLAHSCQRLSSSGWRKLAVNVNRQLVRVSPAYRNIEMNWAFELFPTRNDYGKSI